MADKDILTMLTSDDSAAVADSIIKTQAANERLRNLEHELWQKREEDKNRSRMETDTIYRRHVEECNWHNRIMSLAVIATLGFLIKMLLA